MSAIQYQSVRDHDKVRQFFIRYSDRLMYGTDLTFDPDTDPAGFRAEAHAVWLSDWRYLGTGEKQHIASIQSEVRGLELPRKIIDRIYFENAKGEFVRLPLAR